jgi:queuosine precursor transporter
LDTLSRKQSLFVFLAAGFVTCLVVGDLIGNKLTETTVSDQVFVISVGMIPFPVTFLLTDLLNEFYGKRAARFVTMVGFVMAVFTLVLLAVAIQLPWAAFTKTADWQGVNQASFDNVFGGSQRILFASLVAYLLAQFLDIAVFNYLKMKTRNEKLWLRATGSTLFSQLIDTVVVQVIAWAGLLAWGEIGKIAVLSYTVKIGVAVLLTPMVYAGHSFLEKTMGIHPVVLDENGEPIAHPHG